VELLNLDLPTMYGDHHVTEVRRLLLEIPGVEDVYASSGFQMVEVKYDPAKLEKEVITNKLEQAGYIGELSIAVERGALEEGKNGAKPFFRRTAAYEQTGQTISFAQTVPFAGRPLWPCPGMGPIKNSVPISQSVPIVKMDPSDKSEEELSYG
jgi:copper chaperone CopZ